MDHAILHNEKVINEKNSENSNNFFNYTTKKMLQENIAPSKMDASAMVVVEHAKQ